MDQDKMTIKAMDALQEASSIARQNDHAEITNEHILIALLEQKALMYTKPKSSKVWSLT